ncbi:histidine kinase [Paenibacillus sp. HWE-109]|uniref:cache domain-containing sensor histidine kinase n=1 Tax=Paenibacillus sp. HWE-109 TaxID=1306526 RepID=UPI001EDD03CE|nr:sensor histidine kinase [Paenibacillus sp. HWE-109]UKS23831.1 histidine kinase [Paenibacillus sp. HWE-109]
MLPKGKIRSLLSGWKMLLFALISYTVLFLIAFQGMIISKQSTATIQKQYNQIVFDKMDSLSVNLINYLNYIDDFARTLSVKTDLTRRIQDNHDVPKEVIEGYLSYFRLRLPLYIQILTDQNRVFAYPPIDQEEEERFKATLSAMPWYGTRLFLDNSFIHSDVAPDFHYRAFPQALYISKNMLQDDHSIGTLTIKMNGSAIETLLDTVRINPMNAVFILSPEDQVLFANTQPSSEVSSYLQALDRKRLDELIGNSGDDAGSGKLKLAGQDCYFIYKQIPSTTWKVLSIMPMASLHAESISIWQTTGITTAFSLLLIVTFGYLLYTKLLLPLQRMSRIVRIAGEGESPERYVYKGFKELETLNGGIYRFFEQIQTQIQTIKEVESEKRRLEVHVLQEQMRPHFWHNSLNALRFMAVLHGNSIMADAILALTRMLDYTLKNAHTLFSKVEEEKEYALQYIRFQEIRSMQRIELNVEIEPQALQASIPKFTLQPLLENAITHGFCTPFDRKPTLCLRIHAREEGLCIWIEDNGNGIEADKLRTLLVPQDQERKGESTSGISLLNLQARISLEYGSNYGVRVHSKLGEGTRIEITLPLIINEEKAGDPL